VLDGVFVWLTIARMFVVVLGLGHPNLEEEESLCRPVTVLCEKQELNG